jgi:hypothetical protein
MISSDSSHSERARPALFVVQKADLDADANAL